MCTAQQKRAKEEWPSSSAALLAGATISGTLQSTDSHNDKTMFLKEIIIL